VNDQLKDFLSSKNALEFQSGFRKKHSTSTAIIKLLNCLMVSLDNKNHAALFIDLSKAFDFVDHEILNQMLLGVGLSVNTVGSPPLNNGRT